MFDYQVWSEGRLLWDGQCDTAALLKEFGDIVEDLSAEHDGEGFTIMVTKIS